jgi:hypothetical protein
MKLPQDTTVLLQDQQSGRSRWLSFRRPLEIITTVEPGEVMQCLKRIEARVESGLYAAGFISYEAAPGLDPALKTHAPAGVPCLWFGIFDRYDEVEPPDADSGRHFSFDEWEPSISREQYSRSIEKIKHHIREGDTIRSITLSGSDRGSTVIRSGCLHVFIRRNSRVMPLSLTWDVTRFVRYRRKFSYP